MTMSIGGVTIPVDEQPDRGAYPYVRQQRWVSEGALGLVGSVQQYTGTYPLRFTLHFPLSRATLDDLQAIYEAQASGAGPYAFINDAIDEPYASGFNVIMHTFLPVLSENNRGLPWYETEIEFEEVVA